MKRLIRSASILLLIIAASATVLFSCSSEEVAEPLDPLTVYFFDAGKADAVLLTTENGTVLIDAGESGFGDEIVSYLENAGIDAVDYLIITHFDKDHVGGAAKVIGSVKVGKVLQSNYPKDSKEYDAYVGALSVAALSPDTVRETFDFELDGVKYSVDPPAEEEYSHDPSNNSSLIVTVTYGKKILLFAGDAENERMAEYIDKGLARDCDFVKIPHHGRWDGNLKDLIGKTRPEYAVITSSDEEPEDEKTVELLDSSGVMTFYTRTAPVRLVCDGVSLTAGYDGEMK